MNDFAKVLVVDDGERAPARGLSAELARRGYASVTTSVEAAEDVLGMMPPPAAILLQLPPGRRAARRKALLDLARRLEANEAVAGIPIVLIERPSAVQPGGASWTDPLGALAAARHYRAPASAPMSAPAGARTQVRTEGKGIAPEQ